MIKIITVENKKLEKEFVLFPFDLYKDCKYWVAPIINEELEAMARSKNPVFKNAEAEFYLAYKDGEVVGRIAAIVNWVEIEEQKKNKYLPKHRKFFQAKLFDECLQLIWTLSRKEIKID